VGTDETWTPCYQNMRRHTPSPSEDLFCIWNGNELLMPHRYETDENVFEVLCPLFQDGAADNMVLWPIVQGLDSVVLQNPTYNASSEE
jgi:hypothetical protein